MTRAFSGSALVVATHNAGKLDEFRRLFAGEKIELFSAADFNLESPEETGTTFLENAKLKALCVARATKKIALADDSGLCVDALDGAPGVYSADWAGEPRDFNLAMKKIHDMLGENKNKHASFVSCLVLAWPDGHVEFCEGRAAGKISWPPRGKKGHGYDPIFIPGGHEKTYGEMDDEEKNSISHRAISFKMMMEKCFT